MRRADRIAVASGGDDSFEQTVEVTPMRGDLVSIEDADGFEKTVAVERGDLLPRKRRRIFDAEPVKTQVSLDLIEIIVVGNDFELGWLSHRSLPNISFRRPLSPCPPRARRLRGAPEPYAFRRQHRDDLFGRPPNFGSHAQQMA